MNQAQEAAAEALDQFKRIVVSTGSDTVLRALVRDVWNDEQRAAFVKTVAGHLLGGVTGDVLERTFSYWRHVDEATGAEIERLVRADADLGAPGAQDDAAKQNASDPIAEPNTNAAT